MELNFFTAESIEFLRAGRSVRSLKVYTLSRETSKVSWSLRSSDCWLLEAIDLRLAGTTWLVWSKWAGWSDNSWVLVVYLSWSLRATRSRNSAWGLWSVKIRLDIL